MPRRGVPSGPIFVDTSGLRLFDNKDESRRVLLPLMPDGPEFGDTAFHAVNHDSAVPNALADDDASNELELLRRCVNDLTGVAALRDTWREGEPAYIARTLSEAVVERLQLDLAHVWLAPLNGSASTVVVAGRDRLSPNDAEGAVTSLRNILGVHPGSWPARTRCRLAGIERSVAVVPLGMRGEVGVLVAISAAEHFPRATDTLLLDVVASQAAIALQGSYLLRETTHRAAVTQRGSELASADGVQRTEAAERTSVEGALAEGEIDARALVEGIPGFVGILDENGDVQLVNRQILEYTGQPLEELKNWGTNGTVHPDDLAHVADIFGSSIAAGRPYYIEQRLRRFDGSYRWFGNSGIPARDKSGQIRRWYILLTDIDDKRRMEDALRQSEGEFRLIVQSVAGMICVFSPEGELTGGNQQLLDYFEQPLEEIGRWATNGMTHPDDLPHAVDSFTASLNSGESYDFETRFRRFDGAFRWFQIRGHPLRNFDGKIVRWLGLLTDVDDRKRAEEELRASAIDLRLTLNSIPGLVCTFTAAGRFEGGNQQFYDYLEADQETEKWATKGPVHPDDRDHSVAVFRNAMITGEPYDYEARARCFDGAYRWFQVLGRPHRDDDGRLLRWYSLLIDVDDRKRAERALELSERNLRLTIDTIPALAWSARADGAFDFLNQHYLDYVGEPLDRLRDWQWFNFIHPDDLPALEKAWSGFRAAGVGGEVEVRIRRHDGAYRWFLFRTNPLRGELGNVVTWYGVNTDIEDRKRAEAALMRSETFLAEGQRISSTGSFSWRVDNDELTFSDELDRIFEFEPGTPVTFDHIRDRVHPEDLPALAEKMGHVRSGHDNPEYGIRLRMPDGRIKHVRVIGHVIRHQDGSLECVGAVQDVTQQWLADDAHDKVRSELAHVTRVMSFGALTASIAHEVNQPLSGIITNASTCLRMLTSDPPNVNGALETARRTIRDGHRATDIVTRLRKMYSKTTERGDTVDLNEAAAEVVALLSSDLQRTSVAVQTEFADDLPAIQGDRVQLQQVIQNLLINASDAMSAVRGRPRLAVVRTERDGEGGVVLSVRDVGVGIGAEQNEHLFQPFFTTKSGGMGIGLSVSRSIIESHSGRLWAAPNSGGGATFSFSIPADLGT